MTHEQANKKQLSECDISEQEEMVTNTDGYYVVQKSIFLKKMHTRV